MFIFIRKNLFHYHSAKAFIDNPRQSGGFILQQTTGSAGSFDYKKAMSRLPYIFS